eukprot:1543271-Rhodomonas_salina.4
MQGLGPKVEIFGRNLSNLVFVRAQHARGQHLSSVACARAEQHTLCQYRTGRNQIQESAISVQVVPGMRFLVFDFGGEGDAGGVTSSLDIPIATFIASMA